MSSFGAISILIKKYHSSLGKTVFIYYIAQVFFNDYFLIDAIRLWTCCPGWYQFFLHRSICSTNCFCKSFDFLISSWVTVENSLSIFIQICLIFSLSFSFSAANCLFSAANCLFSAANCLFSAANCLFSNAIH